jgi:hypothetical protein
MQIDQLRFFRDEVEKQAEDERVPRALRNPLLMAAGMGTGLALGYGATKYPRAVGIPVGLGLAGLVGHQMITNPSSRPWSSEGKALRQKIKGQGSRERRDPRLYSNLRGMATLESPERRVEAHEGLSKGDGTILGAMSRGFGRK